LASEVVAAVWSILAMLTRQPQYQFWT